MGLGIPATGATIGPATQDCFTIETRFLVDEVIKNAIKQASITLACFVYPTR